MTLFADAYNDVARQREHDNLTYEGLITALGIPEDDYIEVVAGCIEMGHEIVQRMEREDVSATSVLAEFVGYTLLLGVETGREMLRRELAEGA